MLKPHRHGTTDARGVFHPQTVRLGRTISGRAGLFSGGCLAWPLSDADYWALSASRSTLKAYAEARGFELEPQAIEA
jgi:hypothetical protein